MKPSGPDSPAGASSLSALERIYATVDDIPRGRVATYGQVAEEAGLPRRARLVGRALRELPARSDIPWFRVLNASGQISPRGDGSSARKQKRLLEGEGVEVNPRGRVDLERYRWRPDDPRARDAAAPRGRRR